MSGGGGWKPVVQMGIGEALSVHAGENKRRVGHTGGSGWGFVTRAIGEALSVHVEGEDKRGV